VQNKVELEGTYGKALLKGRLWMEQRQKNLEGEQDETSQQPKTRKPKIQCSTSNIHKNMP